MNDQQQLRTKKAFCELEVKLNPHLEDKLELQRIIFDLIAYPMIQDAIIHEKAQMLGANDLIENQQSLEKQLKDHAFSNLKVCQCCGLLQQQQTLSFCTSFDSLNLGMGVKLYFMNAWYHTLIFILAFMIYSIYSALTNILVFYNDSNLENTLCLFNQSCGLSKVGTGSKASINSENSKTFALIQSLVGIILIVVWSFIHMYRLQSQKYFKIQMQTKRVSATAFTLMLTNYPKHYIFQKTEQQILQTIRSQFKKYNKDAGSQSDYTVVKINVARPLYNEQKQAKEKKAKIQKQMNKYLNSFRNWIDYRREHRQFPINTESRDHQYENFINFFSQSYDKKEIHDVELQEKNIVFVTMKYSKAKQEIIANSTATLSNMYNFFSKVPEFNVEGVEIKAAPQPEEIIWQNIGFSYLKKLIRKGFIYLIAFILICISFGTALGLSYYQSQLKNSNVSIMISIVITLVAFLIDYAIYYLSFLENQFNKTAQQASIAFKIAVSQVFNCIGVPLAVVFIVPGKQVFTEGGLVSDVFYIGLLNILTPIGRFIDPWNIYLSLRKRYYNRPHSRLYIHGQKKFNSQYANYEMDLGYQYGFIIKTVFFTSFFLCLQPLVALFAPIALLSMYMVNKYRLFYRFHRPKFFTFEVNKTVDWMLNLGPVIFAAGQLFVFSWLTYDDDPTTEQLSYFPLSIANYLAIGVAGLLYIFPFKICYLCGGKQPIFPSWDYEKMRALIPSDYDRSNPITKERAIYEFKDYLQDLAKKQLLPDYSQLFMLSMIRQNKLANQYSALVISTKSNFHANSLKSLRKSSNNKAFTVGPTLYPQHLNSQEELISFRK